MDAGVVISASHNPYHDNGIKIFAPTGRKLDDATERLIEADIHEAHGQKLGDVFDDACATESRAAADSARSSDAGGGEAGRDRGGFAGALSGLSGGRGRAGVASR